MLRSDPPDACALLPQRLPPDDPRCAAGAILATPPAEVHLWFSEPVQPFAGGISVMGPTGRRVDRGPVRVDGTELSIVVDASEEGTYLVRWRVTSGDTHPLRGAYGFSLGHASASAGRAGLEGANGSVPPIGLALQVIARWLHLAGFALGFGPLVFLMLVLRPAGLESDSPTRRSLWPLVSAGVVLMLAAGLLALAAQLETLAPGDLPDADAIGDVLGSSFGRILAAQAATALLLWVLLGPIEQGSTRALQAALLLAAGLAFVDGGAAHATGSGPALLGLTLNAAHMLTTAVWLGGLASLLAVRRAGALSVSGGEPVRRFGRLPAPCLALLVLTGLTMAALQLRQPANLLANPYGRTLLAKSLVVLAVAILAFAGARRGWRRPAVVGAGLRPARRAARLWWLEACGLLAVILLAALLVSLPPPR